VNGQSYELFVVNQTQIMYRKKRVTTLPVVLCFVSIPYDSYETNSTERILFWVYSIALNGTRISPNRLMKTEALVGEKLSRPYGLRDRRFAGNIID